MPRRCPLAAISDTPIVQYFNVFAKYVPIGKNQSALVGRPSIFGSTKIVVAAVLDALALAPPGGSVMATLRRFPRSSLGSRASRQVNTVDDLAWVVTDRSNHLESHFTDDAIDLFQSKLKMVMQRMRNCAGLYRCAGRAHLHSTPRPQSAPVPANAIRPPGKRSAPAAPRSGSIRPTLTSAEPHQRSPR